MTYLVDHLLYQVFGFVKLFDLIDLIFPFEFPSVQVLVCSFCLKLE